ncbi:hypothetical protein GYMLUDRAFT_243512 [Collybiopsis luxurians FD-317 M1]|uniref:Uncharacterized protein n=1 Tax=Collybiopsis luxurians FD-317 M1 TaxID=944289 RepID=A0A0D0CYA8_9AGAR|nr:hypothetical protein GYMLUDRAFT_243512 [Collybiopsis luxurians FD-317 M1]
MKISTTLVSITNFILAWAGTSSSLALPAHPLSLIPHLTLSIPSHGLLITTLLLNALTFQDPSNSSNTIAASEAFDFLTLLKGNKLDMAMDRLKLFVADLITFEVPGTHSTIFPWVPPLGAPDDVLFKLQDCLLSVCPGAQPSHSRQSSGSNSDVEGMKTPKYIQKLPSNYQSHTK